MTHHEAQHHDREALRRRMQDAAALPADDPQRLSVLHEISEAGPWAEAEWLELVCEDERARLELQRVEVPAGLMDRLRSLPDEAPTPVRRLRPRRWAALGAAAALLLALGLGLGLPRLWSLDGLDSRLEMLGLLAADHSRVEAPMTVAGSDPERVRAALNPRVKWEVQLPEMGSDYRLLGARVCRLGGHEVVLTRWARGDQTYTVYEFCATDYELPTRFARKVVEANPPWPGGSPSRVEFWSVDGPCAYAMIAEPRGETGPQPQTDAPERTGVPDSARGGLTPSL